MLDPEVTQLLTEGYYYYYFYLFLFFSARKHEACRLKIDVGLLSFVSEVTHMQIKKLCILSDERPCEAEHVSALYCHGNLLEAVDGLLHFTCDFRDSQ